MLQVVCTIHQPSSDVCAMFDDMLLLAKGRLLYCGPWASVDDYFWAAGFTWVFSRSFAKRKAFATLADLNHNVAI